MCNYDGCINTWLCVCDVHATSNLLLIEAVSLNQVQHAVVASLHDTVMHGLPIVTRHRRGYSGNGILCMHSCTIHTTFDDSMCMNVSHNGITGTHTDVVQSSPPSETVGDLALHS